jgi:hypothetical protein
MVDMEARVQKAIEDITGNESLLEMLDTEAAAEMLTWGKSMAALLVKQTENLDDAAAELALDSRLKAVRQFMRSTGTWAAGKYTDPEDRVQLRERLLGHTKLIFGEETHLPSAEDLDAVLNRVDDKQNTPQQLILKLKELLHEAL